MENRHGVQCTSADLAPLGLTKKVDAVESPTLSLSAIGDDLRPSVFGTAQGGATVTLFDGTTVLGTGVADPTGAYGITGSALGTGQHVLTATASLGTQQPSPASAPLVVAVGTAGEIVAELDALSALPALAGIALTDTHILSLSSRDAESPESILTQMTVNQVLATDGRALAAIQGSYSFEVTVDNNTKPLTPLFTNVFDARGLLTKTVSYESESDTLISNYFPDGQTVSDYRLYNAEGVLVGFGPDDAAGNLIRFSQRNSDGSTSLFLYTSGELTKEITDFPNGARTVYDDNGTAGETLSYKRSYDAAGQLTKFEVLAPFGVPVRSTITNADGSVTTLVYSVDLYTTESGSGRLLKAFTDYPDGSRTVRDYNQSQTLVDRRDYDSAGVLTTITTFGSDGMAPVVTSGTPFEATINRSAEPPSLGASVQASGHLAFVDADLADKHTVSASFNVGASDVGAPLGRVSVALASEATGGATGEVDWTFTVAASQLDALAANQTVKEVFDLRVQDQQGGTVLKPLTISLVGAGNTPTAAVVDLLPHFSGQTSNATSAVADSSAGATALSEPSHSSGGNGLTLTTGDRTQHNLPDFIGRTS